MNRNDENILKVLRAQADRLVQQDNDRNEELAIRKQIGELQARLVQLQNLHGVDAGPTQEERELLKVWARGEDVVQAKLAYDRDGVPYRENVHVANQYSVTQGIMLTGLTQPSYTLGQACNIQSALQSQLLGGGLYANQQQGFGTNRTV